MNSTIEVNEVNNTILIQHPFTNDLHDQPTRQTATGERFCLQLADFVSASSSWLPAAVQYLLSRPTGGHPPTRCCAPTTATSVAI